jgi:hypothetical protein
VQITWLPPASSLPQVGSEITGSGIQECLSPSVIFQGGTQCSVYSAHSLTQSQDTGRVGYVLLLGI